MPENERGVTYSRPVSGTGMPPQERFRHAPMGGVPLRCLVCEIASFDTDSSRSYATVILLEFIVRLFQPPNHESTILLGLSQTSHSKVVTSIIGNPSHKSRSKRKEQRPVGNQLWKERGLLTNSPYLPPGSELKVSGHFLRMLA